MPPLSPDQLLSMLADDLSGYVIPMGGKVSVAGDPGAVVEALWDKPTGFRVVLHIGDDDEATGQPQGYITTYTIEAWMIKAKGLPLLPGAQLIETRPGGAPPFLKTLSDVRARINSLVFPDELTSRWLQYKGTKQLDPLLTQECPTVAWKMSFELTAAIPTQEFREL